MAGADRTVVTDLLARDRMSAVFDKAGKNAMRSGGLIGKAGKLAGVGFKAGAVVAGLGIGALTGFIAQGVRDARSYQKVTAKTAAVLKSTGNAAGTSVKGVKSLASSLESMSGVDEELIINSQNVLATFTNVRNETGKGNKIFTQATKAALDMSVALGTDLQGSTIQLGKALNDPIKGITALQRVGVSFTQQQKDQIKTLVESGHTMQAQKLILGELNREFGGQAKAAGDTFEGSWARAKDALSDTGREIGMALLPKLTDVADWMARKIPLAVQDFKAGWSGTDDAANSMGELGKQAKIAYQNLKPLMDYAASPQGVSDLGTTVGALAKTFAFLTGTMREVSIGWRQMSAGAKVAGYEMSLAFTKAVESIANVGSHLPGSMGKHFRAVAADAKSQVAEIQGHLDSVKTDLAQARVDELDKRIGDIKSKGVTIDADDKQRLSSSIAKVKKLLRENAKLTSKEITIKVNTERAVYGNKGGRYIGGTFVPFATGGAVRGPGTGTSDEVPAMLSNNEHVWTAREVAAVGGHGAVERMRTAALSGRRMAAGGAVGRALVGGQVGDVLGRETVRAIIKSAPSMAKAFEKVGARLATKLQSAVDKVKDLKSQRSDYQRNLRDSLIGNAAITNVKVPDNGRISTGSVLSQLSQQAADEQVFAKRLIALRKAGLNKTQLEQISQDGTNGSAIARALLAGGKSAIGQANTLNGQIRGSATAAGISLGNEKFENPLANARGRVSQLKGAKAQLAGIKGGDVHIHIHGNVLATKTELRKLVVEAVNAGHKGGTKISKAQVA